MLLGSGELGKEVAIELQRFGCEVIAVDRYANAPAMQVAHRSHVIDMLDRPALRALVERERPQLIVPEIEAIATPMLAAAGGRGLSRDPDRARRATDHGSRGHPAAGRRGAWLADLAVPFAGSELSTAPRSPPIGLPCVVKPVMSSSGKGQSVVRNDADVDAAWQYAQRGGRAGAGRVIVEGLVALRLRDHAADRARHAPADDQFLRADRTSADRWRLP